MEHALTLFFLGWFSWPMSASQTEVISTGTLIGQRSPSPISFAVNPVSQKGTVYVDGNPVHSFDINLAKHSRVQQIDRRLFIWHQGAFDGVHRYDEHGRYQRFELECSGSISIIEPLADGFVSAWFDQDQVFFDRFDTQGKRISADFKNAPFRRLLNAGRTMHGLSIGTELWIWSPNHGSIFVLDPQGRVLTTLAVSSKTLSRYDATMAAQYLDLQDSGNVDQLKPFIQAHKKLVVKASPMGLLEFNNEPVLLITLSLLGDVFDENNQVNWQRESVFESLDGQIVWKADHVYVRGFGHGGVLGSKKQPGQKASDVILPLFPSHEPSASQD